MMMLNRPKEMDPHRLLHPFLKRAIKDLKLLEEFRIHPQDKV